ncbi:methyltransferase-like protein 24 [Gigantopelta aegis]|uniref:methyltransferase-like protein 24 n=1 Tax=Gigantopelta aegis TaxID=1735272 RepID=UPI001B88C110|nr:methyltransferase-like protein 24 [Gigantopelta aegis]XP_041358401.1 methyltransferase-like protein 24 [Gigantopelta aegis]
MKIFMSKVQTILFLLTCGMFGAVIYKWSTSVTTYKVIEKIKDVSETESKRGPTLVLPPQQIMNFIGPPEFQNITLATSHEELARIYHTYINKVQVKCNNIVRQGRNGDGGWDVCMDPPYELKKPCLVYSFGINNDWSFDDAVSRNIGCEIHAFDPSMNVNDHFRQPSIYFHATGLDGSDAKSQNHPTWKMGRLQTIIKKLGHTNSTIDLIKIDIEESEWSAFPDMVLSNSLNRVKQFCFEIHFFLPTPVRDPDPWRYHSGLLLFKNLYNLGFRIFKSHGNPWCRYKSQFGPERWSCHEVYMVKVSS